MNTDPIIRVKRSLVQGKVPTVEQLGLGEIAINHYDGRLFIRQDTLGVGIGTTPGGGIRLTHGFIAQLRKPRGLSPRL